MPEDSGSHLEVRKKRTLMFAHGTSEGGKSAVDTDLRTLAKLMATVVDETLDPQNPGVDQGTHRIARAVADQHRDDVNPQQKLHEMIEATRIADSLTEAGDILERIDPKEALVIARCMDALQASLDALAYYQEPHVANCTRLEGIKIENRVLREWVNVFVTLNEELGHRRVHLLNLFRFMVQRTRFGQLHVDGGSQRLIKGIYSELYAYMFLHKNNPDCKVRPADPEEDIHGSIDFVMTDSQGKETLVEVKTDPKLREGLQTIDVNDPYDFTSYRNGLLTGPAASSRHRERKVRSAERFRDSVQKRGGNGLIMTVALPDFLR